MTRRNVELVLLLVAAPVVALLFAMIAINQGQSLDMTTLGVPAAIFVAFVIAHLAVRKFAANADPALLPLSFALSGIGIAFVTSLAPNLAVGQVMWLFVGVACMVLVLVFVRNLDKVANYKYTLMIVGFLLLLSPLVPGLGQEIYGSRIWLHIGSYSFQPGEIAKIVIVLFLAGYLAQNREMLSVFTWRVGPFRLPDIRTLLPLLLMWGIALVIVVFEKDLGSALVFFFVFLVMLYVATGKKFYLVIGLGLIAIGGIGAFMAFGHVQVRVNTWLDPFADPLGDGHQTIQSLYAIGSGGATGLGLGESRQKHLFVPEPQNDFIFSIVCEELGFVGACAVVGLFVLLLCRGITIAAHAPDRFGALLVVGFVVQVALQAVLNVAVVTNTIPNTGISLPFFSSGGTSLMMLLGEMGVVLGVSRGEA